MSRPGAKGSSHVSIRYGGSQAIRPRATANRASTIATDESLRNRKLYLDLESADPARRVRRPTTDAPIASGERTLEDYGYHFKGDKLVSIDTGAPFEFDVYPDQEENQRHYHEIGKLVEHYVYNLLVNECHLRPHNIPFDAEKDEPNGFFFASEDAPTAEYLMIIIHGTGAVRAGQWSRKLIINNGLSIGTQIEYIQRARSKGYAVIVTNTNLNTEDSSRSLSLSRALIRGSRSPEEHACYVWENFVRPSAASRICIVAHSYGGAVVVALATSFTKEFDQRVFAVALTDSPMKAYVKHTSSGVLKVLQKKTINWVADRSPTNTDLKKLRNYGQLRSAGHMLHEWTSHTACAAIFAFFEEERQKLERGKR